MRLSRLILITALSAMTTGCSTFSTVQDWFSSEGEDLTAPVELERIDATVEVKKRGLRPSVTAKVMASSKSRLCWQMASSMWLRVKVRLLR